MATHSSAGDQRRGFHPWVGKWHPTPVFLPGESHGQRSLAGSSPWGHKDSDMPECLSSQMAAGGTHKEKGPDCLRTRWGSYRWSDQLPAEVGEDPTHCGRGRLRWGRVLLLLQAGVWTLQADSRQAMAVHRLPGRRVGALGHESLGELRTIQAGCRPTSTARWALQPPLDTHAENTPLPIPMHFTSK